MSSYFGPCKLCDCIYQGPNDCNCKCGHGSFNHIPLGACRQHECECAAFLSTAEVPSCYECGHSSTDHCNESAGCQEEEMLKSCILAGSSDLEILKEYNKNFHQSISVKTLRRKLTSFNLKRKRDYPDDVLRAAVEAENALGVIGYQKLWKNLRVKHKLFVTRDRVHSFLINNNFPRGHDPKIRRPLHQKPFVSKGPNWIWAADGHEKLAQPYGLYVYGVVDTFSRRIMSLTVIPDKKAVTVTDWLVGTLKHYNFMPKTIMIDKGGEWTHLKEELHVIQMRSIFNQKIEALWSQFGKQSDVQWFKDTLRQLDDQGLFTRSSEIDRWCMYFTFGKLLQTSLNSYRDTHNFHRIRLQKRVDLPTGSSPDEIWHHPDRYKTSDYREDLNPALQLQGDLTNYISKYSTEFDRELITKTNCQQVYVTLRDSLSEL